MSAPTAIFCRPTSICLPRSSSTQKSLKPCSFPKSLSSKSVFSGGFVTKRDFSLWGPIAMTELNKTSAFRNSNVDEGLGVLEQQGFIDGRNSNVDEGLGVLEQQAFIDGSSEFRADGLESTLNRLSKWLVAALFGVVILWRHDAEALWAAMGSVFNTGLSVALKRILNQDRPNPTSRSDPGMPSSHAQSIFFTVMFTILSMVEWLGVNGLTLTISALVLAFGSYLSWLRVSQQLHTTSQVVVGATLGSIFSILWFWSWKAFVLQAFISSLWVRIFVVIGGVGFCVSFLIYVIRHWLMDEQ